MLPTRRGCNEAYPSALRCGRGRADSRVRAVLRALRCTSCCRLARESCERCGTCSRGGAQSDVALDVPPMPELAAPAGVLGMPWSMAR
mgnify:CR=1 FL=1